MPTRYLLHGQLEQAAANRLAFMRGGLMAHSFLHHPMPWGAQAMSGAMRVPVIDVAALDSANAHYVAPVANAIGRACREIGYFYVVGHQVLPVLLADTF